MDREEFYKAVKEMVPKYLDQAYAGHQVVIKEFHEAEGTKQNIVWHWLMQNQD